MEKRIEAIESWVRTSGVGTSSTALGYTMGEPEGRLLKRIQALDTQFIQITIQELPNCDIRKRSAFEPQQIKCKIFGRGMRLGVHESRKQHHLRICKAWAQWFEEVVLVGPLGLPVIAWFILRKQVAAHARG